MVYLEEFSKPQIDMYLDKNLKEALPAERPKIRQTIQCFYNFSELARRPMFLDYMVENLLQIDKERKRPIEIQMYEFCIASCWKREKNRRNIFTSNVLEIIENLAYTLWKKDIKDISNTELFNFIKEQLREGGSVNEGPDIVDFGVRSVAFLKRDKEGNYSFALKSLQEFFIAKKIEREFSRHNFDILDLKLLSAGTIYFFLFLRGDDTFTIQLINKIFGEKSCERVLDNALYIFYLIQKKRILGIDISPVKNDPISPEMDQEFSKKANTLLPKEFNIKEGSLKEWYIAKIERRYC